MKTDLRIFSEVMGKEADLSTPVFFSYSNGFLLEM